MHLLGIVVVVGDIKARLVDNALNDRETKPNRACALVGLFKSFEEILRIHLQGLAGVRNNQSILVEINDNLSILHIVLNSVLQQVGP